MIRITVEHCKEGRDPVVLARGTVTNDGSGDAESGNYMVALTRREGHKQRFGHLRNFPRRKLGIWELVCCAVSAAVGERDLDLRRKDHK